MATRAGRATISDVARAAGVQPSTVSKALNGGRGSPEVRARVAEAARRLGYRPNAQAQALRRSRTRSVGLLVPDLANPVFLPFLRGVERAAQEHGHVVLIADGQRDAEVVDAALARFFDQGVDGVVLAGPVAPGALDLFLAHDVPVAPGPRRRSSGRSAWDRREAEATAEMAARLVALGHRRVLFVATPPHPGRRGVGFARARWSTLTDQVEGAGGEVRTVFLDPTAPDPGTRELEGQLGDRVVSVVVCGSHLVVPAVLQAAAEAQRTVPDDLSIVGYGDSPWARAHRPPLTVVGRDTEAEGRQLALELLADLGEVERPPPLAPTARWVERPSLGPAPG